MFFYRVIFTNSPFKGLDSLEADLVDDGWTVLSKRDADPDARTPREVVLTSPDGKHNLHYIDDPRAGLDYFAMTGPKPEPITKQVQARVPHTPVAEVLQRQDTGRAHAVRLGLAMSWPDHREEAAATLRSLASHPDPDVREYAARGMGTSRSTEWVTLLANLADNDPDEDVRRSAFHWLQQIAKMLK